MDKLQTISMPEVGAIEFSCTEADVSIAQPRASLIAAMVFGSVTFVAMAITPILLGSLVRIGRLSNGTLGTVATLEMLGVASGSTIGLPFFRRGKFRLKVAIVSLLLVLFDGLSFKAGSPLELALVRAISGLMEGGALAAATLILTYVRNPERMNGFFLGITAIPPLVVTYILGSMTDAHLAVMVGFSALSVSAAFAILASLGLSDANFPASQPRKKRFGVYRRSQIIALFTVLLQNAGIGAAYSYLTQIAGQHGVPQEVVGSAVAALQAVAVFASFAVGWGAWRLPFSVVLTLGCLVQAIVSLGLGDLQSGIGYLIGCCVFGLCWNGLLPFSLKLLIDLDRTRSLGLLNAPISLAGFGLGPITASLFVTEGNVTPAYWASALLFSASAGLYFVLALMSRSRNGA
jgi:MFS family permease